MVLSGCFTFGKYLLFCVSIIFTGIGLGAITLILWTVTRQSYLSSMTEEETRSFYSGLCVLFSAGLLMVIVSILGCCGAIHESQYSLISFIGFLLLIIVVQITAGTWLYVNSNRLEELLKTNMINTIKNKYGEDIDQTDSMDTFQSELGCCGATGPADWTGSKYSTENPWNPVSLTVSEDANNEYKVPESCCKDRTSGACKADRKIKVAGVVSSAIYSEGCIKKIISILKDHKNEVIGLIAGAGTVELFGLVLCIILSYIIGFPEEEKDSPSS